jgi:precorrin-6B methylase 1
MSEENKDESKINQFEILAAEAELLRKKTEIEDELRTLREAKQKTPKEWVQIRVYNLVVKMIFTGDIMLSDFERAIDQNIKQDFSREQVKRFIKRSVENLAKGGKDEAEEEEK